MTKNKSELFSSATPSGNIEEMKNYLSGYKLYRDLLELEKYEREFLRSREWSSERPGDLTLARVKMFEIRNFILSLPNSNEKILLYIHYIDCEPIERCGDIMGKLTVRTEKKKLDEIYQNLPENKKYVRSNFR